MCVPSRRALRCSLTTGSMAHRHPSLMSLPWSASSSSQPVVVRVEARHSRHSRSRLVFEPSSVSWVACGHSCPSWSPEAQCGPDPWGCCRAPTYPALRIPSRRQDTGTHHPWSSPPESCRPRRRPRVPLHRGPIAQFCQWMSENMKVTLL